MKVCVGGGGGGGNQTSGPQSFHKNSLLKLHSAEHTWEFVKHLALYLQVDALIG